MATSRNRRPLTLVRRLFRISNKAHDRGAATALLSAVLLMSMTVRAGAQEHAHHHASEDVELDQPLEGLGAVDFPISCSPRAAQGFARGVALLHHMMYVEAGKAFGGVAELEPDCAMAHWGVAMTLFQPLWPTRPDAAALAAGWESVEAARAKGTKSPREAAYIEAAAAFFDNPASPDYWARIRRFEAGMERVAKQFPDDHEAAALYALALLATAPESDRRLEQHGQAAAILLDILEAEPTHPGAIHYTIHANDIAGREGESLEVVRSYDNIAPSVPHALHMPTHIFVRLGAWDDVIHWNRKSAAAALDFPAGDAISHHYLHALDYLIYAHLQRGEDEPARQIVDRATASDAHQQTFIAAFHLAAVPARFEVERRQWESAAALEPRRPASFPWDSYPWPESLTHYARGLGAARSGRLEAARESIARLAALSATAEKSGEAYFAEQIEISRLAVAAWVAQAEGESETAASLLRQAAERERKSEKHPVTPGALQPAAEMLGDLLMEQSNPAAALAAYEESLELWPGRANSLLGGARAASSAGDRARAAALYRQLLELAGEGAARLATDEARAFLSEAGAG